MATDRKTVHKHFGYLRCDDFAAYLEEMAAKGWHLESWGAALHFVKGAPEQVTYAVEVFSDATDYDTRPEPNTQEFAEYCEAAGWHLVDARGKMCIFKKLRSDALPITTQEERLDTVFREERKGILRNILISGIWVAMRWGEFLGYGFLRDAFLPQNLMILIGWTTLFLAAVGSFFCLVIWKIRSKKRIRDGLMLHLGRGGPFPGFGNRGYSVALIIVLPMWLSGLVWMGEWGAVTVILVFYAAMLLMGWLIARFRPDAVTNQIIQILVSCVLVIGVFIIGIGSLAVEPAQTTPPEDLPLRYEDIGGDAGALEHVDTEYRSSVLGSMSYFGLFYEDGYVVYFIYESEKSWVLDRVWEEETSASNWEDCTDLWEAEQAVSRFGYGYVVRYPDRIITFNGIYGDQLTHEQIARIRDILCP